MKDELQSEKSQRQKNVLQGEADPKEEASAMQEKIEALEQEVSVMRAEKAKAEKETLAGMRDLQEAYEKKAAELSRSHNEKTKQFTLAKDSLRAQMEQECQDALQAQREELAAEAAVSAGSREEMAELERQRDRYKQESLEREAEVQLLLDDLDVLKKRHNNEIEAANHDLPQTLPLSRSPHP